MALPTDLDVGVSYFVRIYRVGLPTLRMGIGDTCQNLEVAEKLVAVGTSSKLKHPIFRGLPLLVGEELAVHGDFDTIAFRVFFLFNI